MIEVKKVSLAFSQREIFKNASFTVADGDKVGVVGRNGSGKTTLLKLVEGEVLPDSGQVIVTNKTLVASVSQKIPTGRMSLKDYILASNQKLKELWSKLALEKDDEAVARILAKIDDLDGYSQNHKAARILSGIGFSDKDIDHKAVDDLPGGLRMRLSIAALLFRQPDVMLLDEPTNHLDLEGTAWLRDYLRGQTTSTLFLVSHDADLLDAVTQKTLYCTNGQALLYKGNFTSFQMQRAQEIENLHRTAENVEQKKQKILAFADRFHGVSSKARQVNSKLKILERFNAISLPIEEKVPNFHFRYDSGRVKEIINLSDVSIGYNGYALIRGISLDIQPGETIGVLGANGNGKSTLLRTLAGELSLVSGKFYKSQKASIAYLGQVEADGLSTSLSVLDYVASIHSEIGFNKLRAQLANTGFDRNKVAAPVKELSGGERTKLLLMLLGMKPSNVLILDEPTNHLDYDSKVSLSRALSEYPGAKVIVSHDSCFLSSCADRFIAVGDGLVREFKNINDYLLTFKSEKKGGFQNAPRIKEFGAGLDSR